MLSEKKHSLTCTDRRYRSTLNHRYSEQGKKDTRPPSLALFYNGTCRQRSLTLNDKVLPVNSTSPPSYPHRSSPPAFLETSLRRAFNSEECASTASKRCWKTSSACLCRKPQRGWLEERGVKEWGRGGAGLGGAGRVHTDCTRYITVVLLAGFWALIARLTRFCGFGVQVLVLFFLVILS